MKRTQEEAEIEVKQPVKNRKSNENDMFQLIAQLLSLSKLCDQDLDVLHLVVLGDQATGKSTLLNRLIGYELLPSRCETDHKNNLNLEAKTLCPISLHTINRKGKFSVTVKSQSIDETVDFDQLDDAQKNISDALNRLQSNGTRSGAGVDTVFCNNLTIDVTVAGPNLQNMHFVDLPGNRNDKQHISNQINSIIEHQVTKNKNAVILFLMNGSNDPSVTSTWSIINRIPNKNDVILILTRPDGRGEDDQSLIHFLDTCQERAKIPRSNIFIVKNKDSTNKDELKIMPDDYDSVEMSWFMNHNIYSKYIEDSNYSKHFGKANLNHFILDKLKSKLFEQIPGLQINIKKILKNVEDERNKLGSKLIVNANVDRACIFVKSTKSFLQKLDDVLKGKNDPVSGTRFKKILLGFKTDISQIKFNGDITYEEIVDMAANSGGIGTRILGSDDQIVHHILFEQKKSPYQSLIIKVEEYIDTLHDMFCQILNNIDCSDSKIDSKFWQALKDLLLVHTNKENVRKNFIDFCRTQKHNYNSYLVSDVSEQHSYKDVPGKTFKYNPVNTIQKFWHNVIENIGQNFPKYVREFLIEENIDKYDDILKENMEVLYVLIKEPDNIEEKRLKLDQGILLCNNILHIVADLVKI